MGRSTAGAAFATHSLPSKVSKSFSLGCLGKVGRFSGHVCRLLTRGGLESLPLPTSVPSRSPLSSGRLRTTAPGAQRPPSAPSGRPGWNSRACQSAGFTSASSRPRQTARRAAHLRAAPPGRRRAAAVRGCHGCDRHARYAISVPAAGGSPNASAGTTESPASGVGFCVISSCTMRRLSSTGRRRWSMVTASVRSVADAPACPAPVETSGTSSVASSTASSSPADRLAAAAAAGARHPQRAQLGDPEAQRGAQQALVGAQAGGRRADHEVAGARAARSGPATRGPPPCSCSTKLSSSSGGESVTRGYWRSQSTKSRIASSSRCGGRVRAELETKAVGHARRLHQLVFAAARLARDR